MIRADVDGEPDVVLVADMRIVDVPPLPVTPIDGPVEAEPRQDDVENDEGCLDEFDHAAFYPNRETRG